MIERTCSECGSPMTEWLEDCFICEGSGCLACTGMDGKMTVIQCENSDCIFGELAEEDYE